MGANHPFKLRICASQRCAWCEKIHAQLGCVARVWPGAFAVLLVPCCCQVFHSLLFGNCGFLRKIVHADNALSASCRKYWTAEFIEACNGLRASDRCTDCVKAAIPLPLQDFVVDLRERLHAVWRELDSASPSTHAHILVTYHAWMASPLKPSTARDPPYLLPRYLQLEQSRHVLRKIARFRLRAHTLRVETGCMLANPQKAL